MGCVYARVLLLVYGVHAAATPAVDQFNQRGGANDPPPNTLLGGARGFAFEVETAAVARVPHKRQRCHVNLHGAGTRSEHASACTVTENLLVGHMNDACVRHAAVFSDSKLKLLRSVLRFIDVHRTGSYVRSRQLCCDLTAWRCVAGHMHVRGLQ